jgi:hypothetical protein
MLIRPRAAPATGTGLPAARRNPRDLRRTGLRWLVGVTVVVAIAAVVRVGLRGADVESPEKAIYAVAHGLELRDGEGVCGRLFASTALPATVARRLRVAEPDRAGTQAWARDRRRCVREFDGQVHGLDFADPRVQRVTIQQLPPGGAITRTAIARVRFGRGHARTVQLVEHNGTWKVVSAAN